MNTYDFMLVLSPGTEMNEALGNALYEAGCDDCTPGCLSGVPMLLFHREAVSLEDAIRSAIADVQKTGSTAVKVEMDVDTTTPAEA